MMSISENTPSIKSFQEESVSKLSIDEQTSYQDDSIFNKNFNWWSLFGVSFGLTSSWLGVSSSLGTGISSGGPVLIVYGLLIAAFFSLAVGITLSELVSAFPNSGGQYYWTLKLAPARYKRFLAYSTGCLSYFGSVFTSASVTSSLSVSIIAVYCLNNPDFNLKRWHIFLTYEILNLVVSFFNIWSKPLPLISSLALYMSIITFLVTLITCLGTSSENYNSPKFVFKNFVNTTGWDSTAMAFIVGLINPIWCFAGLDAATHMVDELGITRSRVLIPRAILLTVLLGFVTAFAYSISMFFCIKDSERVVNAVLPILEIYYQATNNKNVAIFFQCLCITCGFLCNINANTWQVRICWSFSRDNGLPGSRYWSIIHKDFKLPVNAHLFSNFWIAIIGCIFIGSSKAFNAIISASITLLLLSYVIPTICLLIYGRDKALQGPFKVGIIGFCSNILTLVWCLFCLVFLSFPYVKPVTSNNMNYVSVVYGVIMGYICIYWLLRGKRKFT